MECKRANVQVGPCCQSVSGTVATFLLVTASQFLGFDVSQQRTVKESLSISRVVVAECCRVMRAVPAMCLCDESGGREEGGSSDAVKRVTDPWPR